jgi:hypothetical protein
MKKFNLFKEIVKINKNDLINAVNIQKEFCIDINGNILFDLVKEKDILIYKGKPSIGGDFTKILGKNYQVVDDNDIFLVKAFSNWQEIIELNSRRASYDDTTADGVAEFSNKDLEDIGWHATEFNINYRTLVEFIEEKCEGTLICIEQDEPYKFSGLGFITDDAKAKELLFDFCQKKVKDKIEQDEEFSKEILTNDEMDAAEFFNAL